MAQVMPSFADHNATVAIQTITASSLASSTLKSIIENPLTFQKATLNGTIGLQARYTPLNKPVIHQTGWTNGFRNGISLSSRGVNMSESADEEEPDGPLDEEKPNSQGEDKVSSEWPRIFQRPPGLKNFSNTCYMNSTLQALMHVPPLVTYLLARKHGNSCLRGVRGCAFCRLERHARDSYPEYGNRQAVIEPCGIIGKTGVLNKFLNIFKQEDAHEFLLHLLDKTDEAEKRRINDPKQKSIIQKIFGGEVRQGITCDMEDCGHVSHTSQAFMDLSLDLLTRERDITGSLRDFTQQETLSYDNLYKCEKCNNKSRAKKTTTIHSVPPILSIHLKRFSATGLRKNTMLIQYPEELDLNPYMSEESKGIPKYRLIATICHHGFDFSGMSSGHYTANCKSASGVWNNFDDTRITRISLDEVLKDRDAYILFYARDDPGGHSRPPALDVWSSPTRSNGVETNGSLKKRKPIDEGSDDETPSKKPGSSDNANGLSGKKISTGELSNGDSPSKKRKISDSEEEDRDSPSPQIARQPLKSVSTTNLQTGIGERYAQASYNGVNGKHSIQSSQNGIHRPYGSKVIPQPNEQPAVKRGADTDFFAKLGQHDLKRSEQGHGPHHHFSHKHRSSQLQTTTTNPYALDKEDAFASGFHSASARHIAGPGIRRPGIASPMLIGPTPAFMVSENRNDGKRDQGIKRRHMMRM